MPQSTEQSTEQSAENDLTQITFTQMMTPDMVNFVGNVHGGHLLKMLDQVAAACASQYSSSRVVTLALEHVLFLEPVHISNLVSCYATVTYTGKTSMEVGIRVEAKNLLSQSTRHVMSCYFTMVAVDDEYHPQRVKPLQPVTEQQKRRYLEGKARREHALGKRRQKQAKKETK